jgi:hypothetical protein
LAPAELLSALQRYHFTDPHGHPLHLCAEFAELCRRFNAPFLGAEKPTTRALPV